MPRVSTVVFLVAGLAFAMPALAQENPYAPPAAPAPQAAPAASPLPPFLKVGCRISVWGGSNTVGGAKSVPDANGAFVGKDGVRFSLTGESSMAGVGCDQLTILRAEPGVLGGDDQNFLNLDVQNNVYIPQNAGAKFGTDAIDEVWTDPAKLARTPAGREPTTGISVSRAPLTIGGRTFNSLAVYIPTPNGYRSIIEDCDTGLRMTFADAHAESNTLIRDADGNVSTFSGTVMTTTLMFMSVRQLTPPWPAEDRPAWAAPGKRFEYGGTEQTSIQGVPDTMPPSQTSLTIAIDRDLGAGCVSAKQTTVMVAPWQQQPLTGTVARCFGSTQLMGLWVPPKAIPQLRQGQLLDEDPITKRRTTFEGVRGNVAIFAEQGPVDRSECSYDVTSGMLVAMSHVQQPPMNPARTTSQSRLVTVP